MNTDKHAVICGFGRSGQYRVMAHCAKACPTLRSILILDRVQEAAAAGENVVYGNATRRETLVAAGISRASVLIVSSRYAAEQVLSHVRELVPGLPVVVRTVDEKDFELLQRAGAAEVVPETLEAAMMLSHAPYPCRRADQPRARDLSDPGMRYRTLRGFFHGDSDHDENAHDNDEPRLCSVSLNDGAYAIGRTLGELAVSGDVEVDGGAAQEHQDAGAFSGNPL